MARITEARAFSEMNPVEAIGASRPPARPRLDNIDLLRGLVMVIMALDHVRGFFSNARFDPTDLTQTTPALFLTRWITHFCAPTFVFLSGVSAYLYLQRGKTKTDLFWFLLSRGLWIVLLEVTFVRCLGWSWSFNFTNIGVGVLWAIGWSLVFLAFLQFLPTWLVTLVGLVMILGHNSMDGYKAESFGQMGWLWSILHSGQAVRIGSDITLHPGYPLVPWIGVVAAGYGLGAVFFFEPGRRRRFLFVMGSLITLGFIALRGTNLYGDPVPWSVQENPLYTVFSFLKCHKYPPSLCFLMMTLGPSITLLAVFDRPIGLDGRPLIIFGRVPMFYYLLHLPLIHAMAAGFAVARYGPAILEGGQNVPRDYGYSLPVVYGVWMIVILILFPPCWWFANLKQKYRWNWLSYL